jgi:hypothetical protein
MIEPVPSIYLYYFPSTYIYIYIRIYIYILKLRELVTMAHTCWWDCGRNSGCKFKIEIVFEINICI